MKLLSLRGCAAASAVLLTLALPAAGASMADRLYDSAEEPQNWLMNLGDYAGHRYSSLAQIDRSTVGKLVPRFSVPLGGLLDAAGNFSAALPVSPLVKEGFLYIVDGFGAVYKLDLRAKGAIVWRSAAEQNNLDAWLEAGRGLAFADDSILSISADGRLNWIADATGAVTRSVQVGDPREGYTISAPPLVIGDRVIVGGSGAGRAARSQIDAINASTGEAMWRLYPGRPGERGGSFLQTGVLGRDGTTYWGTSASFPSADENSEPKSFGNAVLALDVASGAIRWTYRYPAPPEGTFSEAAPYQLLPGNEGRPPVVAHFGNDGRMYLFDPEHPQSPRLIPYLDGLAQAGLGHGLPDLADGMTVSGSTDPLWQGRPGCPNVRNLAAFAAAYSPATGLVYGTSADGCHPAPKAVKTYSISHWLGAYYAGADNALGLLSAVDPNSGQVAAQHLFDFPLQSGALATGGGLVFTSTAEGTLYALDDRTLDPLWSTKFGVLSSVPPISFAVDGEQFIAVVVGGNSFDADLSYKPKELGISEDLFVLVVLGLPE